MKLFKLFFLFISVLFLLSCTTNRNERSDEPTLFRNLPASETNIDFRNELVFKQEFNIYRYRNFYNGGGVAFGDINNDGLLDIYFTSNMGDNRLYLNKGDMKFEDITAKAAVAGERAWSTGVSIADVNGDGLVDIYVCNSGIVKGDDRKNELYINNGDLTFTEMAEEYGIADEALSIHGTFFDYDKDGDLDLYLANNSYRSIGSFDLQKTDRNIRSEQGGGDKLYRNNGGYFTEVSREAGIYSSEFGFALGVSIGDVNRDGWSDIYISNDFFERDYLYLNNRDGSFSEVLQEAMNSISAASMGADIADLNNDGYPEIFVTDMLPEPESRLKLVTTFDNWEGYREYVEKGFHHQFTRNTLQYNNADGTFSEIGRWAGVEATDWSWGANIADFDLDGRRDIFVANGIYQDLTNLDYLAEISQEEVQRKIIRDNNVDFKQLVDLIPQTPISNYAFHNLGNMQFADSSSAWGLDEPGFSNGSAYGDLDNDGDLDLVINNIEDEASVYENRATGINPGNRWLQISFKGTSHNKFAFGAQVTAWAGDRHWFAEQIPVRGFQSTMDHRLHLGLGGVERLDSLIVFWPDSSVSKFENVETNQMLIVDQNKSSKEDGNSFLYPANKNHDEQILLQDVTDQFDIDWKHRENEFVDFKRDRLLFHMRSTEGPALCVGDADGDGLEDFYVGGAKDQAGALFLQNDNSKFTSKKVEVIEEDASGEDVDCAFFDADGDGLMDLYVARGGNEFPSSSSSLVDRLYLNQGGGFFEKSEQPLPGWSYETTSVVRTADYDNDGDTDLFVGVRLIPFAIGFPARGYLLENDGKGNFEDVTEEIAPDMMEMGMTTDAVWADMEGDGYPDLWTAGEWMPLIFFENKKGALERRKFPGLDVTSGWWRSLAVEDLNGDGYLDIVAGNHGLNSRFRASESEPMEMWTADFNKNGTIEQIVSTYKSQKRYPMALRHHLIDEIPTLSTKYPSYKSFAGETVEEIFSERQLKEAHYSRVNQLASIVAWNNGNDEFSIEELPFRAQLSPVYGILPIDLTGNGDSEIVMGGNLHNVKPEVGRYDAGYGLVLTRENESYRNTMSRESGFHVTGEIRAVKKVKLQNGVSILIVARNDDRLKFFEINGD